MTKKTIISQIREYGVKATYGNLNVFRNKDFEIVGGCIFFSLLGDFWFKIENETVIKTKSYEEIKPLIMG